ncbi:MAG: acyl-CoA dehydrogenase family protein [Rhodospirillales bacterium]|jgi:alkylation response protein AidB-like acyl-CoA dehydrogenase|nr:acyl-CoA dehydrogenase family protein [Rhodospirillales bacterium]HJO73391.1 acyl-CoA dehydrogenase family protein [Rhodospirillales bacterium]
MELGLSEPDEAFRQEVRAFIAENLPADIKRKVETGRRLDRQDYVVWQKILHARGWIAPGWPEEFGGTGWTPIRKYIFEEELAMGSTPGIIPFGLGMVAPVIMAFGTDQQKKKYLPRILATDDWWCQGYSEPGAGSDLASLKTRAAADGDDYVVNGAKTWTTMAQYADMMFCLVRTSDEDKKQNGISFLLIDMKSAGVTVRPITTIDGGSDEINEVFLDDVRVPQANRIGEEGKGWTYAKFLLGHERTGIAAVGRSKKQLMKVKEIAARELSGGAPLIENRRFAEKVAMAEIDMLALESVVLKVLSEESAGRPPGPEASLLKIKGTELQQAITELLVEAIGEFAHPYVPEALEDGWNEEPVGPDYAAPLAPHYFNWRKASIYSGSNEIQKNIIAKMVLGF